MEREWGDEDEDENENEDKSKDKEGRIRGRDEDEGEEGRGSVGRRVGAEAPCSSLVCDSWCSGCGCEGG